MKKTIFITSLVTLAIFGACCKKTTPIIDACGFSSEFITVTVPFSEQGGTVIPSLLVNLAPQGFYLDSILGQTVPSTVEAQVNNNGQFKTCQTSSINITQFRITIDSPATQNFGFIDSVNLYLRKKDGSGKLLVAKKGGIINGTKQIVMDLIPNLDIKEYVIKDSFAFTVGVRKGANNVANTTDPTYIKYDAGFSAKVFTK